MKNDSTPMQPEIIYGDDFIVCEAEGGTVVIPPWELAYDVVKQFGSKFQIKKGFIARMKSADNSITTGWFLLDTNQEAVDYLTDLYDAGWTENEFENQIQTR